MNIFLVHENYATSAKMLAKADPIRARKQLLECCQLLAHFGLGMYKVDGTPYKLAHPNHPITRHMKLSYKNYLLCWSVAYCLADLFPSHACSKSFDKFYRTRHEKEFTGDGYIVCRKGQPVTFVNTLAEYAALMREYCETVKGMRFE